MSLEEEELREYAEAKKAITAYMVNAPAGADSREIGAHVGLLTYSRPFYLDDFCWLTRAPDFGCSAFVRSSSGNNGPILNVVITCTK